MQSLKRWRHSTLSGHGTKGTNDCKISTKVTPGQWINVTVLHIIITVNDSQSYTLLLQLMTHSLTDYYYSQWLSLTYYYYSQWLSLTHYYYSQWLTVLHTIITVNNSVLHIIITVNDSQSYILLLQLMTHSLTYYYYS